MLTNVSMKRSAQDAHSRERKMLLRNRARRVDFASEIPYPYKCEHEALRAGCALTVRRNI